MDSRSTFEHRHARAETGASAVEFAIVLSVLLIMLMGTIQFGIAFNRNQGLQAAAREGARIASIGGTSGEIRARVRQAQSLFVGTDVGVRIDYSTDDGATWSSAICDDSTSTTCSNMGAPTPCSTAGLGNLIRVTGRVPATLTQYAISIPLWGQQAITYEQRGTFRCERIGA